MSIYTKGAVSAAALLMAVSFAQAQSGDRIEKGPQQGGQEQSERGGGDKRPDGQSDRGARGDKAGDNRAQQGQPDKRDDRSAQDNRDRDGRPDGKASDRRDGPGQADRKDRSEGKQEKRRFKSSAEHRPRYRDAIKRHSSIKRYRRSDVQFSINLGTRIPNTFVFYDAPSEFYEIDPEFRGYKIIVLDDVILVVDPDTREIVDVISI